MLEVVLGARMQIPPSPLSPPASALCSPNIYAHTIHYCSHGSSVQDVTAHYSRGVDDASQGGQGSYWTIGWPLMGWNRDVNLGVKHQQNNSGYSLSTKV